MKRGKFKCLDHCDTENHHLHKWCKTCARRIDLEDNNNHNCNFGTRPRIVHPDMDPAYLYNDIFWQENLPFYHQEAAEYYRHNPYHIYFENNKEENTNKRNREESSTTRVTFSEPTKQHDGKRFKRFY